MVIYIAGAVSGNLKPAWKSALSYVRGGGKITAGDFIRGLSEENF